MGRRFEVGDIVVWSEDAYPEYKAIGIPNAEDEEFVVVAGKC